MQQPAPSRPSPALPSSEAGAERLPRSVLWLYSLPRIGIGIMGLLFVRFAFNEREHAEVRAVLDARNVPRDPPSPRSPVS